MCSQVDPAAQGLFLLDSQVGFGCEVSTESNSLVENKKLCSNSSKRQSIWCGHYNTIVKAMKRISCLSMFLSLACSYAVFWVLKERY